MNSKMMTPDELEKYLDSQEPEDKKKLISICKRYDTMLQSAMEKGEYFVRLHVSIFMEDIYNLMQEEKKKEYEKGRSDAIRAE